MISNKKTSNKENNKERISYLSEILPDYQKRTRATINNLRATEEEIITNVNVDEEEKKSRMRKYFDEFASNTTIHGFNHLGARHRHPLERCLAGIFILAGFACFIYVSAVSWYRYQYDGFITLVDKQQEFIRLVKPSLLICPKNLIDPSKFPDTFKRYDIMDTPKNREFFYLLTSEPYDTNMIIPDYQPAPPELWLNILNDLKKEFYCETSLPGKWIWVVLEVGICLSIGNHVHPYVNIEYILANNKSLTSFPTYPPDISNYQIENREVDDPNYIPSYVYYPDTDITEFLRLDIEAWVELIDPMEIYKTKGPRNLIELSGQLYTTVDVELFVTTHEMDHIINNKYRRYCRFPSDGGLDLWPIYTYLLCAANFRAHLSLKRCGCYQYIYPRISDVPICNVTQFPCNLRLNIENARSFSMHPSTMCFYNCNYIHFFYRTVKLQNSTHSNITNMEIKINFPQYKHTMKERFSFSDFMTSVGSAAGLFLGCSVLSFVEIFYYATLHIYTNKHKYKYN